MYSKSKSPVRQSLVPDLKSRFRGYIRKTASLSAGAVGMSLFLVCFGLAVGSFSALAATQAEERAKGEELLKKARLDLAQATQMQEASLKLSQAAQTDMLKANQKKMEARALLRDAHLLIRNSNRMRADELREHAATKELRAKTEEGEVARLQGLIAHENQSAADAASAVSKLQEAARNETSPTGKAELATMAQSLSKQSTERTAEMAGFEKRIAAINAEIIRLRAGSKALTEEASHLDPSGK